MALIVKKNRNSVYSEDYKSSYGTLTEGLNTGNIVGAFWNIIVLIRWLVTLLILVIMRDAPEWQIVVLLIISVIFQCAMLHCRPYEGRLEN